MPHSADNKQARATTANTFGKSLRRSDVRCPGCGKRMKRWIVHSFGMVACEPKHLAAMRRLQRAADRGKAASATGGRSNYILPMWPFRQQKYAHCRFCEECRIVVIAAADQIPPEKIPKIAK